MKKIFPIFLLIIFAAQASASEHSLKADDSIKEFTPKIEILETSNYPEIGDIVSKAAIDTVKPDKNGVSLNRFEKLTIKADYDQVTSIQNHDAKLIIFENTNDKFSSVYSTFEIIGQKADFIYANPNNFDFTVDFINANNIKIIPNMIDLNSQGEVIKLRNEDTLLFKDSINGIYHTIYFNGELRHKGSIDSYHYTKDLFLDDFIEILEN